MFEFVYRVHSDMTQIRGTPASGKTTLAKLLQHYIRKKEPGSQVVRISSWRSEEALATRGGWRKWLAKDSTWNSQDGSVLIVDEAQTSYWDVAFWNYIKDIRNDWRHRIITLVSYGGSGTDSSVPIPFSPFQRQVVGLRAIDHGDGIEAGLLLTQDEFQDFVEKRFDSHRFDEHFLDSIYRLTTGHVGACEDLLGTVRSERVSCTH